MTRGGRVQAGAPGEGLLAARGVAALLVVDAAGDSPALPADPPPDPDDDSVAAGLLSALASPLPALPEPAAVSVGLSDVLSADSPPSPPAFLLPPSRKSVTYHPDPFS